MPANFQLYYITDRSQIPSRTLDTCIAGAIAAGVDWVQIREKDLPARRLLALTEAALEFARPQGRTRVMVNDRLDVALAAKAHGVHLGTRSMRVDLVRRLAPDEFVVGASCHSPEEALTAQAAGADYILLGPIFATPSKLRYGPPLGVGKLREVASQVSIPVFALGGITIDRVAFCRRNGAAGIAGIRIFQDCDSVEELVRELREMAGE
ncbi:MAG: thiamine phosphate synthase [Terriglobia bacterium]|jgi:thiamine-phosphate pyrophosphorylase